MIAEDAIPRTFGPDPKQNPCRDVFPKRPIELLAPARDCEAVVAAVDYGADAVCIGGARFGARHAAANDAAQIARAVEYARRYGVRVYATLNTLLRDDELEAERQARELIGAGGRCAYRAGHGAAAHEPARGAARLDPGAHPDARACAVSRTLRLRARDSPNGPCRSTRSARCARRHERRGRVLRCARGHLRGIQRPLLPFALDGSAAQRQPGRMRPALPPGVGPHRRPGPHVPRGQSTCCRCAT